MAEMGFKLLPGLMSRALTGQSQPRRKRNDARLDALAPHPV